MKVILHDEKYLSLTSEIFLQKNTRCGQIIIYTVFILLVAICVSLFTIRIDEVVKVQGIVKTQTNISTVKNIVSGKVLNINYFSGKIVKKNDLLFKIDDSNLVLKLNSEKELEKKYQKEWKMELDKVLKEKEFVDNDAVLKFILSPNDLVYVPTSDELRNGINADKIDKSRVYKMVSSSGSQCFFINNKGASIIDNKVEYSPLNKMERSISGEMIKEICIPIKVDRLGNVIEFNGIKS